MPQSCKHKQNTCLKKTVTLGVCFVPTLGAEEGCSADTAMFGAETVFFVLTYAATGVCSCCSGLLLGSGAQHALWYLVRGLTSVTVAAAQSFFCSGAVCLVLLS